MAMASLSSDDALSKKIVFSFLEFLQKVELKQPDDREGVEIVIDCLQNIFSLDLNDGAQKQAFGSSTGDSFPFYIHSYDLDSANAQKNTTFGDFSFGYNPPNSSVRTEQAKFNGGAGFANGFSNADSILPPTHPDTPPTNPESDHPSPEPHSAAKESSPPANTIGDSPEPISQKSLSRTECNVPESETEHSAPDSFREIVNIEDLSKELQDKFSEFLEGLIDAGYFGEFLPSSEEYSQRLQVAKGIFLNSVNQARMQQHQSDQEKINSESPDDGIPVQDKRILENTVNGNSVIYEQSTGKAVEDEKSVQSISPMGSSNSGNRQQSSQSQQSNSSHIPVDQNLNKTQKQNADMGESIEQKLIKAEDLKSKGNKSMSEKKYADAIKFYSQAISIDNNNAIYFCNRAAAYQALGQFESAVQDCERAIVLNPKYSKAYSRLGQAYSSLNRFEDAISKGFTIALELDCNNQIAKEGLEMARKHLNKMNQPSYAYPTQLPDELARMAMERNILSPEGLAFVNHFLKSQNFFQGQAADASSPSHFSKGSAAPHFRSDPCMQDAPDACGCNHHGHKSWMHHEPHPRDHSHHKHGHHACGPHPRPEGNQGAGFVPDPAFTIPNLAQTVFPTFSSFTNYLQNNPGFDPLQLVQNVVGGAVAANNQPKSS